MENNILICVVFSYALICVLVQMSNNAIDSSNDGPDSLHPDVDFEVA